MKNYELVNYCEFDEKASKSYCAIHGVDESKNLGDITKVDENKLDEFNFICGGSPCFKSGTLITTDKGLKNIEDIIVGDYVLTHTGYFQKVLRIGNKFSKEIYKLKIQGSPITFVTSEHPYYTINRFYENKNKTHIKKYTNPNWKVVKDLDKNDFVAIGKNNYKENIKQLTEEECWLIGRYIADGYIRNNKRSDRKNSYNHQVIFCIGKNKIDEFKKHLKEYYVGIVEERTAYKARLINERFMNLCLDCEKGAENKVIPQFILNLPQNLLEIFLDGYMSGDGCFTNNQYKATSVSKKLIYQLGQIINKLDSYGCYSIYYTKRNPTTIIEGRLVNQKDTWSIAFTKEHNEHSKGVRVEKTLYQPFKGKELINDYNDLVYNLEVENDNSYVANNCVVHNCQDFSVAGKLQGAKWVCKDCGEEYNPLYVNWRERERCPHCNSINLDKSRSSLLVEWLRIINVNKPNFGIYENVKNIVGKFKPTFDLFIEELHDYGYNTYWQVLKASDYGVPQRRERVYLFIVKKELDNGKFEFPKPFNYNVGINSILEINKNIDKKYYNICPSMLKAIGNKKCKIVLNNEVCNTVTTKQNRWNNAGFVYGENNELRFFTELELFRLMGFSESDFNKVKEVNNNRDVQQKQAGNSIVVNVLYEIYKEIYKVMPYLFDNLKVSSYFSGIGAFEKGLNMLFDDINNNRV